MTTLLTLACILLLAAAVARYGPKEGGEGLFRLEQFRLGAPLGGIFADPPSSPESADWTARPMSTEGSSGRLADSRDVTGQEAPRPD
jgi:hypothetical protein